MGVYWIVPSPNKVHFLAPSSEFEFTSNSVTAALCFWIISWVISGKPLNCSCSCSFSRVALVFRSVERTGGAHLTCEKFSWAVRCCKTNSYWDEIPSPPPRAGSHEHGDAGVASSPAREDLQGRLVVNDDLRHFLWPGVQEQRAASVLGCHQPLQNAVNHPYFTLWIVKTIIHFIGISGQDSKFQGFFPWIYSKV